MRTILFFFLACLFLLSCQPNGNNSGNSSTTNTGNFTSLSDAKSFYKQLRGTIGTQPITINLIKKKSESDDDDSWVFSGYFYYDAVEKPTPIWGKTDTKGNINFEMSENRESGSSSITCKQNPDGTITGVWADTLSTPHKSLPVIFHEAYNSNALQFDYFSSNDSAILFKGVKDSPKATYQSGFLVPTASTDKTIAAYLNKEFLTNYVPSIPNYDSIPIEKRPKITYPTAAERYKVERDFYFKDYYSTLSNEKPGEASYNLNYDNSTTTNILYNSNHLLSIAETTYNFTGGAHGMTATTLSSYQLQNFKKLSLEDLFKPGYQPVVSKLLEADIRQQLEIKPNEPLSSALFVDKIEVTDNFAVTQKGILFLYNADEIASHAQGDFEIFIPFSELKSVLKM